MLSWLLPISYPTRANGIIISLNSQPLLNLFKLKKRPESDVNSGRQTFYAEQHLPHSLPYRVKCRYNG